MHLSPATGRGAGRCRGRLDEVGGWAWTRRIKGADHSIDEIGPVKVDGSGSGEVDIILSFRGSAVGPELGQVLGA